MIALVDYSAGNLTSVRKALAALGAELATPQTPGDLDRMSGIIVPGVGHFEATRALDDNWRGAMRAALNRGVPFLGICLGMQWLFEGSTEAPGLAGLGAFHGVCERLPEVTAQDDGARRLKIPHVGWNTLEAPKPGVLMAGVEPEAQVYFTHSYVAPVVADSVAVTTYGVTFSAAVERGRLAGVQFHPEKSGEVGLRILRNWLHAL